MTFPDRSTIALLRANTLISANVILLRPMCPVTNYADVTIPVINGPQPVKGGWEVLPR